MGCLSVAVTAEFVPHSNPQSQSARLHFSHGSSFSVRRTHLELRVSTPMTAAPTITVASYNMRKAIGTDRRRRPDRVLHVLQEIDADVVALQEADKRIGGR